MGSGVLGTYHSVIGATASAKTGRAPVDTADLFCMPIRFVEIANDVASQRVLPIVNAALRIGRRRVPLHTLAIECGLPKRTLQWRLMKYTRCSACSVLAFALLAYAAWDLERHGWNVKHVSAAAGFGSREAFTNYVRRHIGSTPGRLACPGATRSIVDRWLAALNGAHDHVIVTVMTIDPLRVSL